MNWDLIELLSTFAEHSRDQCTNFIRAKAPESVLALAIIVSHDRQYLIQTITEPVVVILH